MAELTIPARAQARDRATWTELFYDLVLAFGVGQIAHALAAHPGWHSLGGCLLVLTPLWWAWVDVVMAMNAVRETSAQRVFLLLAGLATYGMGVAAPHALETRSESLLYAGCYLALRLVIGEAIRRECAVYTIHPYRAGLAFALALFGCAVLPDAWRTGCWAVAVGAEILAPLVLSGHLRQLAFGVNHLPERFGLFVIIALGENVVSVGARLAGTAPGPVGLLAVALAFLIGCALWWLYFHLVASAVAHALRTHPTPSIVVRDVLSYGHLVLVSGLLLVSVGADLIVAEPVAVPHAFAAALLPTGAALFILTFCYTRWRMFGAASATRFLGGLALLGLVAAAPRLPGLVTLAAAALILVSVNALEYWLIASGRQVPLIFRTANAPARASS
ncbi:low temperature requirement protein A [Streptomyces sp. SID8379]|uniref:low temperature requirement protein A n=1 Tax=unclassified Streptomyces TaxID=2593676 RepID=UPI000364DCB5|nr:MULTISPECIES: low temperature requirement protein A [unclassified Streptomyces]MYW67486.1 low temperature requirement protein A [Streptomyces sp. SID8379]